MVSAERQCRFRIQVDWSAGDDEEQVALRLQSLVMVTLPPPHDHVVVGMHVEPRGEENQDSKAASPEAAPDEASKDSGDERLRLQDSGKWTVRMNMRVHKQREPLHVLRLTRIAASSSSSYSGSDGLSMLAKLLDAKGVALHRADVAAAAASAIPTGTSGGISGAGGGSVGSGGGSGSGGSAGSGGALVLPNFTMNLPLLEVLEVENNRLSALPGEIGQLQQLRVLRADNNQLTTVPITLRECTNLRELSLENNRLVRPLLDFRCLADLRVLRLFNNPLEFFPEILPCRHLRMLSLANVRIVSDPDLKIVDVSIVQLEAQQGSYFSASKHCLSDFFALIFRYSSVHHPLLASALARICEDRENRAAIGKDESAIRQIVSMLLADSKHVVEQACHALSSLAMDDALVTHLVKSDVLAAICSLLLSQQPEILVSVLRVIANLALASDSVAARILNVDSAAILTSLCHHTHMMQPEILVSVLRVIANLALASDSVAARILNVDSAAILTTPCSAALSPSLPPSIPLSSKPSAPFSPPPYLHPFRSNLFLIALMAVGNLSFCPDNRRLLVAQPGFLDGLYHLATGGAGLGGGGFGGGGGGEEAGEGGLGAEGEGMRGGGGGVGRYQHRALVVEVPTVFSFRKAAARVLAILGENRLVQGALCTRAVGQRGVRILVMDGGGMRGMAMVQMLRQIEGRTGRRVHELFDLVCGTSTGGMLAAELGIKRLTLDQCDDVYRRLGKLVFSNVEAMESASWRDKLDQLYKSSSQNYRVVVHGSKHNAEQFEQLLQEMCTDDDGDLLIDSAVKGGPKVFVVSTLVSVTPATPFVFRNYQYPPGTRETPHPPADGSPMPMPPPRMRTSGLSALLGTCKMQLWQAIRASSAAPYYFDDFAVGPHRWQDGAIFANNPTIVAVREARLLWPDLPLDCVVSLGCGSAPPKLRGRPGWRVADTGQVLAEAATSVEQADLAFESVIPMLPDVKYYRFNPVDERCGMDLDETDPAEWEKLETATDEYLTAVNRDMAELCKYLRLCVAQEEADKAAAAALLGGAAAAAAAAAGGYRSRPGSRPGSMPGTPRAAGYSSPAAAPVYPPIVLPASPRSPKTSAPASPLAKVIGPQGDQRRGASGSSLHAINPYRRHVLLVDSIRPSVARRPWQHSARLCCSAIGGGGGYINNSSMVSSHEAAAARLAGIISSISTDGGSTGSLLSHLRRPPKVDEHICEPCDPPSGSTAAAAASTGLYFSTSLQSPFSSRPSSVPGSPRITGSASAMAAAAAAAAGASASGGASPHFGSAAGLAAPAAAGIASAGAAGMRRSGSSTAIAAGLGIGSGGSGGAGGGSGGTVGRAGVRRGVDGRGGGGGGSPVFRVPSNLDLNKPTGETSRPATASITPAAAATRAGAGSSTRATSTEDTPLGVEASFRPWMAEGEDSDGEEEGQGGRSTRQAGTGAVTRGYTPTSASGAAGATVSATAGRAAAAAAAAAATLPSVGARLKPVWTEGGSRRAVALSLSPPAAALMQRLQQAAGVGLVHLALPCDQSGFILTWSSEVMSVAEPSDSATRLLARAIDSIGCCFVVDGVLHRFMGCHTQILPGGMEVSTYLFSCTAPAVHLTEADIRWMASSWRDRIIVCTGKQGPPTALTEAFLDTGAKAVIAPPPAGSSSFPGHFALNAAAAAGASGMSPCVDSAYQGVVGLDLAAAAAGGDVGRLGKREAWLDDVEAWIGREDRVFGLAVEKEQASAKVEEERLGLFLRDLYSGLFDDGFSAPVALEETLKAHPGMKFSCHVKKR
ncbi:unnamed protein product [Closterium sp. NIES-65]|nr:unnamed protein product [Closterium sp. NIES-65]